MQFVSSYLFLLNIKNKNFDFFKESQQAPPVALMTSYMNFHKHYS
jgi:hypothetical protein